MNISLCMGTFIILLFEKSNHYTNLKCKVLEIFLIVLPGFLQPRGLGGEIPRFETTETNDVRCQAAGGQRGKTYDHSIVDYIFQKTLAIYSLAELSGGGAISLTPCFLNKIIFKCFNC